MLWIKVQGMLKLINRQMKANKESKETPVIRGLSVKCGMNSIKYSL
jgi:hypothetical protein